MKKHRLLLIVFALIAFGQTAWTQNWQSVSNADELSYYYNHGATHLHLTDNITLSSYWEVNNGGTVYLDLNGHTLQRTGLTSASANGHVIEVYSSNTLNIVDNSTEKGGTLTGGWANNGGGICNYGTVTLENVIITGCKAGEGGAIKNNVNCSATLNNVTITDCEASDGGGVWNASNATLNINVGSITSCESTEHGGGGITNYGTININGVNITGNTCKTNGSGIWDEGTINMQGNVQIKGNTYDDIFLKKDKVLNITGALTGGQNSIGIRMQNSGTFTHDYNATNAGNTIHFFPNISVNYMGLIDGEGKMFYGYYEASWDDTNKEVVFTRRTVPENVTVYNICSAMYASGGGLSDSEWFVAEGTGTTAHGLTCGDGVRNLILCDDAAITINEGFFVNQGSTLHIYCQSYDERMGKLISKNTVESWPGIGGKDGYMGTLVIHGGDIRAKGGQYAAGIGGREDKPNGPITIYGGKIDATGGENGAGIGGGEGGSGEHITIYGGRIWAEGAARAAGIGGGEHSGTSVSAGGGNCDDLTIWGGTITARGGSQAAGIGGGSAGFAITNPITINITIHGGNIHAVGGIATDDDELGGAGIGGGDHQTISSITINGGHITAEANHNGAGIGAGGYNTLGGTITINGGEIEARGGIGNEHAYYAGAGIGGGGINYLDSNEGSTIINGGTIVAIAGFSLYGENGAKDGVAIGCGRHKQDDDLIIPEYYSVKAGTNASDAVYAATDSRIDQCRSLWAKVEPCQHIGATYVDEGNGVAFNGQCPHCMMPQGTINFIPYTFQTDGNYNNPDCWFQNIKPGDGKSATLKAAAVIPNGVTIDADVITLGEGGSLTIKEGGQLLHNSLGVNLWATVEKGISHYTVASGAGNTDGWHFIASPIYTGFTPDETMLSNTYDLYRFNPSAELEWENYKAHDDFTELVRGQGYLYANNTDVTLNFTGHLIPYKSLVENHTNGVNVSAGWNLVGNSFVCNAYADRPFYKMNAARTGIVAVDEYWNTENYIAPCTGFVVHSNAAGAVWLTHTPPQAPASSNHGSLQIALAQANNERNAEQIDNAIVSFNEGSTLPKFRFGDNAEIYLPQNGEDYAIVSVGGRDGVHTVSTMPINFKAKENGQYTLSVNAEGVDMAYLHLIDNLTGADIDLLLPNAVIAGEDPQSPAPSYTFTAKTTDYESRFKLVFASICEDANDDNESFAFTSNGNIIINGEGTLQVIDMMGRVVVCTDVACNVSTQGMTAGVYVLRLINGNDIKTQKIIIK